MKNTMESPATPENKERMSKILLHFMRHGEKGKVQPGQTDYEVHLTPEGRKKAKAAAKVTNLKQAMSVGSPRERAQETAAFLMAGAEDDITGAESFDELKAKLNEGLTTNATRVFSDKRLDFTLDDKTPLGAKEMEAYLGKRWMPFLINESDKLAVELGDNETSTYSRMAGVIAEIVEKYAKVSDRWHELVNDEKKQYEEMMERFLGSHQGVTESFLAKVVEKTKGAEERDRFVKAVNNQGFDFLEGFDVEIDKKGESEKPAIKIRYRKADKEGKEVFNFDEEVPAEVIEEIIKEGERK